MIFHSGFSLRNDHIFFEGLLKESAYCVAGFSYGAIHAALFAAENDERIDTLQLFSPAFFQTKKESFRRLQMGGYLKDSVAYTEKFIESCFAPCPIKTVELDRDASEEQLHELLYFEWTPDLMKEIRAKGIRIEVYLGLEDRVIDVAGAREFFIPYATVTSIRGANHFLQECL
jgi:pimeloyl-ACP methyl ester carboxylesterase